LASEFFGLAGEICRRGNLLISRRLRGNIEAESNPVDPKGTNPFRKSGALRHISSVDSEDGGGFAYHLIGDTNFCGVSQAKEKMEKKKRSRDHLF
jgi:hypothetical protein